MYLHIRVNVNIRVIQHNLFLKKTLKYKAKSDYIRTIATIFTNLGKTKAVHSDAGCSRTLPVASSWNGQDVNSNTNNNGGNNLVKREPLASVPCQVAEVSTSLHATTTSVKIEPVPPKSENGKFSVSIDTYIHTCIHTYMRARARARTHIFILLLLLQNIIKFYLEIMEIIYSIKYINILYIMCNKLRK